MRLKFWNRWKREKKINVGVISPKDVDHLRGVKADFVITDNLVELSNEEKLEKWNRHKPYVTDFDVETIASKNIDLPLDEFPNGIEASDDDIFTSLGDLSNEDMLPSQRELKGMTWKEYNRRKEDQCHGKLKSGARCSRVIDNAMYCWQHKQK